MNYTATRKEAVCELVIQLSAEEVDQQFVKGRRNPEASPAKQVCILAQEQYVQKILDKEHIIPVSPLVISDELPEAGKPYDLHIRFESLPDIALPSQLEELNIEVPPPSMDGHNARRMADAIRHSFARRTKVTELRSPVYGEVVVIDMNGSCENCPAPGFQAESRAFLLKKDGSLLPEIQAELLTMLPGQSRIVELPCPEDYPYAGMRGKTLTLTLCLKAVFQEHLPEINAEFAKELGFDSVKALETSIMAKSMSNELASIQKEGERRLLQKLLSQCSIPAPSYTTRRYYDEFMQNARTALQRAHCSEEQITEQLKAMEEDGHRNAEEQARAHVFLLALAEREHIRVSEQDMKTETERLARDMKTSPDTVREQLEKNGLEDDVRERILAVKALTYLYNKAHKIVVDEKGDIVPPPVLHTA